MFDSVLRHIAPPDESARRELHSLSQERDADFFWAQLLCFGTRQQLSGNERLAAQVYETIARQEKVPVEIARDAAKRLEVLEGRGSFGARFEVVSSRLLREVPEATALIAFGVAGAMFKVVRLSSLSRLLAKPVSLPWTRGFGANALASFLGFSAEGLTFPLARRLAKAALGRPQEGSLDTLAEEVRSSYAMLGGLHLAGWVGGALLKSKVGGGEFSQFLRQGSLLGGIYLGNGIDQFLRGRSEWGMGAADAVAMLLHYHVSGRIVRAAFGQRFAQWENEMDWRAELLGGTRNSGNRGVWTQNALASPVGPAFAVSGKAGKGRLGGPNLVFAQSTGSPGGRRPPLRKALREAKALREQIAAPEATERRAQRAKSYFAILDRFPRKGQGVLEEVQAGVSLVLTWMAGSDGFQRAIAARHYIEAWTLLAHKIRDHAIAPPFADQLRLQLALHAGIFSKENNSVVLGALLEATPAIAHIFSQVQWNLAATLLSDSQLYQTYQSFIRAIEARLVNSRSIELRRVCLEALSMALDSTRPGDGQSVEEILSSLKLLRTWITGTQPELQKMALYYLPIYWDRMAAKTTSELRAEILGENSHFSEEVAHLHRTKNILQTRRPILESSLNAYPSYAETLFNLTPDSSPEVLIILRTMLQEAGLLRRWVAQHRDADLRDRIGRCYVGLIKLIDLKTYAVMEKPFPEALQGARQQVFQELKEEVASGLNAFKERMNRDKAQQGDMHNAQKGYAQLLDISHRGAASRKRWPK